MAEQVSVSAPEWEQLEHAAEATIAAAATAPLWAGGEGQDVLARVAAASPTQ